MNYVLPGLIFLRTVKMIGLQPDSPLPVLRAKLSKVLFPIKAHLTSCEQGCHLEYGKKNKTYNNEFDGGPKMKTIVLLIGMIVCVIWALILELNGHETKDQILFVIFFVVALVLTKTEVLK